MSLILFSRVSGNSKTGPIPVSTSAKNTCPDACPLKVKGCYAASGALNIHWQRVSKGIAGLTWNEFLHEVASLPRGLLWRHNQAGDLPGENNAIDAGALASLVKANKGRRGFTYTHKPVLNEQGEAALMRANRDAVKQANKGGFTVNLSANDLTHADKLAGLGIGPVVTLLPKEQTKNTETPQGRKVVVCPATYREGVTCQTCRLCSVANRSAIIGFPAHGNAKNTVSKIAAGL